MNNLYVKKLLVALFLSIFSISYGFAQNYSSEKAVRILSWWGYLTHSDLLSEVEKTCQTKIIFDEYYNNFEFVRRRKDREYDILIYSNTVGDFIGRDEKIKSSIDISSLSNNYHTVFRNQYIKENHPKNTLYFLFSETIFLWDADKVNIKSSDSIAEIFKKANGKNIVVIDNYIEVLALLLGENSQAKNDLFSVLKNLLGGANLIITNNLGKVLEDDDFAIGYVWSGEAVAKMSKSRKNLKIMIHPSLSHITKDLITLLSTDKASSCVVRELAGEKFISKLVSKEFYFSPYHKQLNTGVNEYDKLFDKFNSKVNELKWLKKFSIKENIWLDKNWQKIKTEFEYRI